jgi:hypothetical protein
MLITVHDALIYTRRRIRRYLMQGINFWWGAMLLVLLVSAPTLTFASTAGETAQATFVVQ